MSEPSEAQFTLNFFNSHHPIHKRYLKNHPLHSKKSQTMERLDFFQIKKSMILITSPSPLILSPFPFYGALILATRAFPHRDTLFKKIKSLSDS